MSKLRETKKVLHALKHAANKYITRRNRGYEKEERFFTQAETLQYLNVKKKVVEDGLIELGIDPRRHEDARWLISLSELYRLRDQLPAKLRIAPKFEKGSKSTQIICIQNQKGGVGKTTDAITIASGLSTAYHEEFRIGLIDLDPQATATPYYLDHNIKNYDTASSLMCGDFTIPDGKTFKDVVSAAFLPTLIPNLRLLPAAQKDRGMETRYHKLIHQGKLTNPYKRLSSIIEQVRDEFDIIIIDTPPNTSFATISAYFAATSVIFPVQASENDMDATCQYYEFIPELFSLVEDEGHQGYDFMKILFSNYKESSSSTDLFSRAVVAFGDLIYPTSYKHSEAVKECTSKLSTIFDMSRSEYSGRSKGTFDTCKVNAEAVVAQVYRDIMLVWNKEEQK